MLHYIFFGLGALAILFFILMVKWDSMVLAFVDIGLWMIVAAGIVQIEIPFQYSSQGQVYTELHAIEGGYMLHWLFIGMAIITFIFSLSHQILPMIGEKLENRRML